MKLISILKSEKFCPWWDAFICLLFTLVGSLAPVWIGAILVRLFSRWAGWFAFFSHGEFSIYSAAFLASTLYLMAKGSKPKAKILFPVIGLLLSAVLFAGVTSQDIFSSENITIDQNFLFNISWPLFFCSIALFFSTNVSENIRLAANISEVARQEYNKLDKNFENLGR